MNHALEHIKKLIKSQESKEDKTGGPDASEINDLASNLQEVSQGANPTASKVLKGSNNLSIASLLWPKRDGVAFRNN